MPDTLQTEISRLVSEAAKTGNLDIGEALKRLVRVDSRAGDKQRDLVNALLSASLRAGVTPQLPIL